MREECYCRRCIRMVEKAEGKRETGKKREPKYDGLI